MKKLPRIITQEEFELLLKNTENKKYKLAMLLGFEAGLRISEIVGFVKSKSRCCNAPVERKKLGNEYGKWKKRPYICSKCNKELILKEIKRDKSMGWEVPPLTKDNIFLDRHYIRINSGKGKKDRIVPLPKRVNEKAVAILPISASRRALQLHITELGKKLLNKPISFHTLRHGFATHLIKMGRPLNEVQMFMGHSRLDTTGVYLHANPKEAAEKARDIF